MKQKDTLFSSSDGLLQKRINIGSNTVWNCSHGPYVMAKLLNERLNLRIFDKFIAMMFYFYIYNEQMIFLLFILPLCHSMFVAYCITHYTSLN